MKTVLAAALAAPLFAVAVPAFAAPLTTAASPTVPQEQATDTKRYCVVTPAATGSFLNRKECRTRAEWMKQGVDPLALRK